MSGCTWYEKCAEVGTQRQLEYILYLAVIIDTFFQLYVPRTLCRGVRQYIHRLNNILQRMYNTHSSLT
jgi:hypothetical protein